MILDNVCHVDRTIRTTLTITQMTSKPKKAAPRRPQDPQPPHIAPTWLPTSTPLNMFPADLPERSKAQAFATYGTAASGLHTVPQGPHLPQVGSFRMPPPIYRNTSQGTPQIMSRTMSQPIAPPPPPPQAPREPDPPASSYTAAVYIEEDPNSRKLADYIGTAAYYKSREFKKKQAAGEVQVPGSKSKSEDKEIEDVHSGKPPSLIMIFGRDTVRRATTNNKFYLRMQKYNKRK